MIIPFVKLSYNWLKFDLLSIKRFNVQALCCVVMYSNMHVWSSNLKNVATYKITIDKKDDLIDWEFWTGKNPIDYSLDAQTLRCKKLYYYYCI